MGSVLFVLEGDALIVANSGRGFTPKGIVSICRMNLSAKGVNDTLRPGEPKCDERDLVRSIREKRIKKYNAETDDLREDITNETATGKSYVGRFVWELLQNADDAASSGNTSTELIGAKGIGFKSVLTVTDEPEIYSGNFNFHFSRKESEKLLRKEVKKWDEAMGVPVCRLPHDIPPDEEIKRLQGEGFSTVIRLPLKEGQREIVEKQLSKPEFDSRCLLFCQNLESMEIRIGSEIRHIKIQRSAQGAKIELTDNGETNNWRMWSRKKEVNDKKQISVSVCLQIVDEEPKALDKIPKLHVFFPTQAEIVGVYAMIHASCEVEGNRKHLADDQPNREDIAKLLREIIAEMLTEIPPNVALHVFGCAEIGKNDDDMVTELSNAISQAVRETEFIPFIGGGMAKPGNVRLWEHGVGKVVNPGKVKGENLCHETVNGDKESIEILESLGAEYLPVVKFAELLSFCRNENEDECIAAWSVAQRLIKNAGYEEECIKLLRKAPFWRVENGKARALDGDVPLVTQKPKNLPDWLRVEVCVKNFMQRIEEKIEELEDDEVSSDLHPVTNKGCFEHILLPYCENQTAEWWQENGWGVLDMAFRWRHIPCERGVGKIFYLPVGKGVHEWVPAWHCYGGTAWGGAKIFDKYFSDIEDRHILSPVADWEIEVSDDDKDKWKQLLSWIGCSWEFKMVTNNTQPQFWFDHFDECVGKLNSEPNEFVGMMEMVAEMFAKVKSQSSNGYERPLNQLKQNRWVLCNQSLLYPEQRLFKPNEVYLPKCGLGGFLPEAEGTLSEYGTGMLSYLGARDKISNDANQLVEYMNQLSALTENEEYLKWSPKKGKVALAANAIFSAYAKIESLNALTANVMVPCLRHTKKGEELYFVEASKVCWADEPYFGDPDVRVEILKEKELHVFFRFLTDGKNFGLKKLSEHLSMNPIYGNELYRKSQHLKKRYDQRRAGMSKAIGKELPKDLEMAAYDYIALKSAQYESIKPKIKFWREGENEVHIHAASDMDMWRGLAKAIGEVIESSQHAPDLEHLLKEEGWGAFTKRLRDDYHLTEDSIEESAPMPMENDYEEREVHAQHSADSARETSSPTPSGGSGGGGGGSGGAGSLGNESGRTGERPDTPSKISGIKVVEHVFEPEGEVRGGGGGRGGNQSEGRQTRGDGKPAEDALHEWLKKKFGSKNVTNANEKHQNNPGYDFLVLRDGEEHYYECKSRLSATPPRRVRITRVQFEKAKESGDRYHLCVLYDINDDIKMLPPICNPTTLESEVITEVTGYSLNLSTNQEK